MGKEKISGKAKLVKVDDIDTDQIFHQSLLTIHDPQEIKQHIFGNLEGYENFAKENHENRILVVGKNFGKGSTRQQAVTGFLAHKIKAIIGVSFGPIYYSNAVNAGLLLVEAPGILEFLIDDFDVLEIDVKKATILNVDKGNEIKCNPIPKPALDIMEAGGLLKLGDKM
ncbi:MAG: 3-isopropylmalate dehydratase [Candidatus Heimdallarchaeota archaeon]|nr:3-isopropylmalate dehydratase [Candidatus Heimdallarchaeota archaeon]MCK4768910.1 3-isopropylmalate dehydratase [Candidatus Heimdallarchaeota archaeon]